VDAKKFDLVGTFVFTNVQQFLICVKIVYWNGNLFFVRSWTAHDWWRLWFL